MDDIEAINRNARRWLENVPLETWSLAHDGGRRWGIITTNHCEVFNAVLKGARALPITACVQLIFYRVVGYFDEGRVVANKRVCDGFTYTKNVVKNIDKYKREQTSTRYKRTTGYIYVNQTLLIHIINLCNLIILI